MLTGKIKTVISICHLLFGDLQMAKKEQVTQGFYLITKKPFKSFLKQNAKIYIYILLHLA